jgi:hypothetical protein
MMQGGLTRSFVPIGFDRFVSQAEHDPAPCAGNDAWHRSDVGLGTLPEIWIQALKLISISPSVCLVRHECEEMEIRVAGAMCDWAIAPDHHHFRRPQQRSATGRARHSK